MVYSSFEKARLKELAAHFPEQAHRIEGVVARMLDLEAVFRLGYWHPAFKGRTSIKQVLPVMVPDRSLSYAALPVNNGDDALGLFGLLRVGEIDRAEAESRRAELLRYCALDTMAMVRLHEAVARLL